MFSRIEIRRNTSLITILALLLTSCGRIDMVPNQPATPTATQSAQAEQALQQLMVGPVSSPQAADISKKDLRGVIEELIAQGKIKVPNQSHARNGVNSTTTLTASSSTNSALTTIENILDLLGSGQITNIYSLAKQLFQSFSGGSLSQDLTLISQILTAALPFLITLAPTLVPVVQGLILILPIVQSFIQLFKGSGTGTGTSTSTGTSTGTGTGTNTASGQSLYDSKCAICHSLGSYDPSGSPNLSGKGSSMNSKFTASVASHQGYVLTANEISALTTFINSH